MLNAAPVESGVYRAVIRRDAMRSLLRTFSGIFSAENAQKKLSLLEGREGETIAAPCVTLMDDPLLPGGFASAPFDGEGSACRTKAVIEDGVLKTLLHSRKTAKKAGTVSTGNAKRNVSSPVRVAPTNFFFRPGEKDLDALLADMGEGLMITQLGVTATVTAPSRNTFRMLSRTRRSLPAPKFCATKVEAVTLTESSIVQTMESALDWMPQAVIVCVPRELIVDWIVMLETEYMMPETPMGRPRRTMRPSVGPSKRTSRGVRRQ